MREGKRIESSGKGGEGWRKVNKKGTEVTKGEIR